MSEIKFEIGKKYNISPAYKKSFREHEFFILEDSQQEGPPKMVEVIVLWRGGSFSVIPQNQEEVDFLQSYYDEKDEEEELCMSQFEVAEFEGSWDGCSEDYVFHNFGDEDTEELETELTEDFYYDVLSEKGWESFESETYIVGELHVEEVDA